MEGISSKILLPILGGSRTYKSRSFITCEFGINEIVQNLQLVQMKRVHCAIQLMRALTLECDFKYIYEMHAYCAAKRLVCVLKEMQLK